MLLLTGYETRPFATSKHLCFVQLKCYVEEANSNHHHKNKKWFTRKNFATLRRTALTGCCGSVELIHVQAFKHVQDSLNSNSYLNNNSNMLFIETVLYNGNTYQYNTIGRSLHVSTVNRPTRYSSLPATDCKASAPPTPHTNIMRYNVNLVTRLVRQHTLHVGTLHFDTIQRWVCNRLLVQNVWFCFGFNNVVLEKASPEVSWLYVSAAFS